MVPVDAQEQAMLDALPEKTGRTLEAWLAHLSGEGLDSYGEILSHLKKQHGVSHGYANLIAQYRGGRKERLASGGGSAVDGQYSGPKAALRPIYDRLVAICEDFGEEFELAPKKAYVSLRRRTQFGLIQPSTKTRVDVGIKLPGAEPTPRLEASGSFNAMVSHRVRVESVEELDDELIGWLWEAFERAE